METSPNERDEEHDYMNGVLRNTMFGVWALVGVFSRVGIGKQGNEK